MEENPLKVEELAAQRTAFKARTVALALIVPLVTVLTPWPAPILTYLLLLVFALLGWGAWWVAQSPWGRPWHQYAFVSADFALLTFTLLFPNPFVPFDYPPQFVLRFGSFIYFFVILAGLAYVYQPRLVLWGGVTAALSWTIGVLLLLRLPGTVWRLPDGMNMERVIDAVAQPGFIDVGVRMQEVIVFLIASGLLALAVKRSRMIALRQAKLAREKENLGRYFPEKTAQMLAESTDPFSAPAEQNCAVLFADIVSFTSWSEKHGPQETIALLRDVHGMLAREVFRHNGTLDKFMGDGVMATFGTPITTQRDATNAINAMVGMLQEFEQLIKRQTSTSVEDLRLAVGVHYGPVVIGNVGSAERLEFAVLGDTVNIASRLENATRMLGCRGLVSAETVLASNEESPEDHASRMKWLTEHDPVQLRGLSNEIGVFTLP
ncbi:MAG: adenylate/guanylate cyclase domain-containing protein [Rhizobiaceae bacterium]|nr:adenylate/guanylate cyclase domain-containing protein [Rhizobiaceae bacterium]